MVNIVASLLLLLCMSFGSFNVFASSEYDDASFLRRKAPVLPNIGNDPDYDPITKSANSWDTSLHVNVTKYTVSDSMTVSLVASPDYLTTINGYEYITLSWSNVETVNNSDDWISVYCPNNGSNDNYLDYFRTYGEITGTKSLKLWNMRCNYEFRYFHQTGKTTYELQGISNVVKVNALQPLQIHLSLTSNSPYEMRVLWVSDYVEMPIVEIGLQSYDYTQSFIASSKYYLSNLMCESSSEIISQQYYRDPGYIYDGLMINLQASTTYFYRVGSKTDDIWSQEYYFTTGCSDAFDNSNNKTIKFAFYGDSYISDAPGAERTFDLISMESNIKFILHIGDLSYALGKGYIWEQFNNMISNVAKYVPYMVSVGNHEYDHVHNSTNPTNHEDASGLTGTGYHPSWGNFEDDSSGECGVPTNERFHMPDNGNSVFWYSFNYEFIHIIMLSSEHNMTQTAIMYNWLENDLKNNVNRSETPWVIIGLHRPIYCTQSLPGQNSTTIHLQEEFENLLYQYKVDAMFSGHFHSYQRSCAVHNNKCIGLQNGGTTHVMVGSAGQSLHMQPFYPANWVEYNQTGLFGWARATANRNEMTIEWVSNNDGSVVDSTTLSK